MAGLLAYSSYRRLPNQNDQWPFAVGKKELTAAESAPDSHRIPYYVLT